MSKPKVKLKVTKGKLDLKSVESLSRDELRQWIDDRLHSRDTVVPGDVRQGDMPHYLFTLIYPKLGRFVRQDIHNIILEFVRDMARNPQSHWRGDAADELLLLAQSVCEDDKWQLIDYLLEIAKAPQFFDPTASEEAEDLHYRALQSLVALGWRGTPEFWQEQARLNPDRYAGVAFDGLALIAPKHAIALLTQIPWTDEVEDQVLTVCLPDLLEVYKPAVIVPLLEQHLPQMPDRAQEAIREFLDEEGIQVSPNSHNGRNYQRAVETLHSFGYNPQPGLKCALVNDEPLPVAA